MHVVAAITPPALIGGVIIDTRGATQQRTSPRFGPGRRGGGGRAGRGSGTASISNRTHYSEAIGERRIEVPLKDEHLQLGEVDHYFGSELLCYHKQ